MLLKLELHEQNVKISIDEEGVLIHDSKDRLLGEFNYQELKASAKEEQRKEELEPLIAQLFELPNQEQVQLDMDDLIFDNCGTGKHWSEVNNQGFSGQAEALAEELGVDMAKTMLQEFINGRK